VPPVRYTARARRDLIDLWLEIYEVNPAAADDLYNRLEARIEALRRYPESGRARPEIAASARALVAFPYLILYRIDPGGVQVVRVLHGARNIDRALFIQGVE
jgi:toxin ParE1/3/4